MLEVLRLLSPALQFVGCQPGATRQRTSRKPAVGYSPPLLKPHIASGTDHPSAFVGRSAGPTQRRQLPSPPVSRSDIEASWLRDLFVISIIQGRSFASKLSTETEEEHCELSLSCCCILPSPEQAGQAGQAAAEESIEFHIEYA